MKVLVVGGGIGGLAAAIVLRRGGHDVAVIESASTRAVDGFSITIPPNGERALHELGVLDSIRSSAAIGTRFEYLSGDEVVVSAPLHEGFGRWRWLCLLRADLIGGLEANAGEIRYATGLAEAEESRDGVRVRFDSGAEESFDLVVGADGAGSTVRSSLPGAAVAEWAGLLYYRAIVHDPDRELVLRGFLGDGRLFGIFPAGKGRVYGWGALPASEPSIDPVAGRRQRLLDAFAPLGTEPQRFLEATRSDEDFSCTPPTWVRGGTWHSDRVVLIGDAAHASPPFMAEGACLAMEDALVLADCLASASLPDALAAYAGRRGPRVAYVHRVVEAAAQSIIQALPATDRAERLRAAGPTAIAAQLAPLLEPL